MASNRTLPLGYRYENGIVVIDPNTAAAAMDIFKHYLAGNSYQKIAKSLTMQGIPMREDKPKWDKHTVRRLLENRKYLGEKNCPQLISDELFEQVSQAMQERNNTKSQNPMMADLAQKCYCADCGHRILRDSKSLRYIDWRCPVDAPDSHTRISDLDMEANVALKLESIRKNPNLIAGIPIQKEEMLQATRLKIRKLSGQNDFTPDQYKDALVRLTAQLYEALPAVPPPGTARLERRFSSLSAPIEHLDPELVADTVKRVLLHHSGAVSLILINGIIVK